MAIVDPESGKIAGHVPVGQDPHELAVSTDGKLAFASNYSGSSAQGGNSISVIDIAARKELHRVDLTPLGRPHGLWFADGKLYFTAEANMVIGRYDPSSNKVDWVLGTGQERTHMVLVAKEQKTIFTSNVESNTISIFERVRGRQGPLRWARRASSRWTWRTAARWTGSRRTTARRTWWPAPRRTGPVDRRQAAPVNLSGDQVDRREVQEYRAGNRPSSLSAGVRRVLMFRRMARSSGRRTWETAVFRSSTSPPRRSSTRSTREPRGPNRLKFTPDGKLALVSEIGGGGLIVLDTGSRNVIKRIRLGRGASGILVPPRGGRAYVAMTGDNAVAIIDLTTLTEVGRLKDRPRP